MVIIMAAVMPCSDNMVRPPTNIEGMTAKVLPTRAPNPARVMAECSSSSPSAGPTVSGATMVRSTDSNPWRDNP